ncbi:unnamed protein product [Caenorhabditis sp. 36 PRJEB53466]|nr:unnamed protein product [Caenorhabditis sp. 36 PRJEB53466]
MHFCFPLLLPLLLAVGAFVGEAASPCRVFRRTSTEEPTTTTVTSTTTPTPTPTPTPTTTTVTTSTVTTTTVTTPTPTTTGTPDPKAPCMAVGDKWQPDDSDYADYSSATPTVTSSDQCGSACNTDSTCAYAYFTSGKCWTFAKFTPLAFTTGGTGSMFFKLYLNGTGTCATVSLTNLASTKRKMSYPDGGTYWLANTVMNTISYGSNNPALGYKRRKRSLLAWLFNM